jgi:two-component system, cell cycle sensor histidine kinase and response regulator CckA
MAEDRPTNRYGSILDSSRADRAIEESERKYRAIVENVTDGLVIHDVKGVILDVNENLCSRLGYSRGELIGAHLSKFASRENMIRFQERINTLIETGSLLFEGMHVRKDGTVIPVEISGKTVSRDGDGVIQSFVRDISERKKMEVALREREELFRSTIEQSADGFMMIDGDMRIIEWNLAMEVIFGFTRGEMMGKHLADFQFLTLPASERTPDALERLKNAMWSVRGERGEAFMSRPQEMRIETKRGEQKTIQLSVFPIFTSSGVRFGALSRDMTFRIKAEEALRASEERFVTAFEHSPLLKSISNIETGEFLEVNNTFLKVSGFSREEVIGKTSVEIGWISQEERNRILSSFRETVKTKNLELTCKARDGRILYCKYFGEIITLSGQQRLLAVAQDITEEKKTRTTLLETDRLLKKAQELAHIGHFHYDTLTGVVKGSEVFYSIFGLPATEGSMDAVLATVDPADRERVETTIRRCVVSGETYDIEHWLRCANGEKKFVNEIGEPEKDANGKTIRIIGTVQDITERKLMETVLAESEKKYRLLFEHMVEGFSVHEIITDGTGAPVDFRFIDVNEAHERHTGLQRSKILGKTIKEVIPNVSEEQIVRYGKVALTGQPLTFEYYSAAFDRHFRVSAFSPQRGRFATIFEDISDGKRSETALRASEERFRQLAENIHAVFLIVSLDWKQIHYVSPMYEEFWGRSCESLYANPLSWLEPLSFEDLEKVGAAIETATETEWSVLRFPEYRVRRPDNIIRWVSMTAYPIRGEHKNIVRIAAIVEDITERKNIQEALRHEEEMASLYFEIAGVMLIVLDASAHILLINKKGCSVLGYAAEELIGKNWIETCIPQENRDMVSREFRQIIKGELQPHSYTENHVLTKDGSLRLIGWNNEVVLGDNHHVVATISSGEDITARRRAEAALAESERRNRDLLKAIPDVIFKILNNGVILDVKYDDPSQLYWPPEKVAGANIYDLPLQKGDADRIKRAMAMALATGEVQTCTYSLIVNQSERMYEARFIRELENSTVVIVRDITESKRAEENMIKTEKLESLGHMAGGIAHDFNNLLGGVFGYLEMAREQAEVKNSERTVLYIKKALTVFDRAKGLTRQFLTFAKGGTPVKKTGDLAALLRNVVPFALSGSNIECDLQLDSGLWPCDFDEHQMAQVFDNLVINAKQAMEKGGRLEVNAKNLGLDAENRTLSLSPGKYVVIRFIDNGPGIPKEIQQKIFDPFFTTKKAGTGLGLATSYSIITRHGGLIDVESEPGKGATFTVVLPASVKQIDSGKGTDLPLAKGYGKILLMDDEHFVRDFGSGMLKNLGYDVETAKNGEDAVALYESALKSGKPFRAAIFDLTIIGGMGGKDAAERIIAIDPNAQLIVSSGYSEDPVMADPGKFGFCGCIGKPYKKQELASTLAGLKDITVAPVTRKKGRGKKAT